MKTYKITDIERNNWVSFTEFAPNADTTGNEDISDLLQKCVNTYDNVFIPKGKYRFANTVRLRSGSAIKGEGGTELIKNGGHLFTACGSYDSEKKILNRNENIALYSFKFVSETPKRCSALSICDVKNLIIVGVETERGGLIDMWSSTPDLNNMPLDDNGDYLKFMNEDLYISDCVCRGYDAYKEDWVCQATIAMCISFLDYFLIENCDIDNYSHGIQFWGGNPAFEDYYNLEWQKGLYEERYALVGKFSNGLVNNCRVADIRGANIWGCCAQYFTIANCVLERGGDGLLDFEGSNNILVTHNKLIDGLVGGPEAILGKVVYSYNEFIITKEWWRPYFFIRGAIDSQVAWYRQKIVFDHNTFAAYNGIASVNATMFECPAIASFIFTNNKLLNTTVNGISNIVYNAPPEKRKAAQADIWELVVENNEFDFDLPLTDYYPAAANLRVGSAFNGVTKVTAIGNSFKSSNESEFCGLYIGNIETEDGFSAVCDSNTFDGTTLKIENVRDDARCSVVMRDNECDKIDIVGNVQVHDMGVKRRVL